MVGNDWYPPLNAHKCPSSSSSKGLNEGKKYSWEWPPGGLLGLISQSPHFSISGDLAIGSSVLALASTSSSSSEITYSSNGILSCGKVSLGPSYIRRSSSSSWRSTCSF